MKFLFFVLSVCLSSISTYKHVVFMHGLFAGTNDFDFIIKQLKKDHPGTNTTNIDSYIYCNSLCPLWTQVYKIQTLLKQVIEENPQGIHLVCFSQGGLVCRGLLSTLRHNVDTFISLSCPLAGQYGDTIYLKYLFPTYLKRNIFRYFYSTLGQRWSVANYWYDPHHQELYREFSQYLAILNNDTYNRQSLQTKQCFSSVKKMVLVGGPDDGVITPWQSAHFGMYNASEIVLPMRKQKWYKDDSFGLKTLDKKGVIIFHTYSGIPHTKWHTVMNVYRKSVLPYLT